MSTETRKRKEMRDLERKRKQQLYILIGIVVVAIVALGAVILSTQQLTQSAALVAEAAESEVYAGITPTVSEEGMPQLGSDDAPLTIYEYSSFGCGHCMSFHDDQFQRLLENVRNDEVRLVFVPVTNQFSAPASLAAVCAAEQGKFWEMHDVLFNYLGQYGGNAYTRERLDVAASALGLDEDAFGACLISDSAAAQVEAANDLFFALAEQDPNVTGTPTLTFNGVAPEWGSGAPQWEYIQAKIEEANS